jgi:hypothetical protein
MMKFRDTTFSHVTNQCQIHLAEDDCSWTFLFDGHRSQQGADVEAQLFPSAHVQFQMDHLPFRHHRDLVGWELRGDPDSQDAREYVNREGNVSFDEFELHCYPPDKLKAPEWWVGEDFVLRFGSRTGNKFVFECEAWLEPRDSFYQDDPRPASAAGVRKGTPPNLLVMGEIEIKSFHVDVAPEIKDPAGWARQKVRRHFGVEEAGEAVVRPVTRFNSDTKESEVVPNGGWNIYFHEARF